MCAARRARQIRVILFRLPKPYKNMFPETNALCLKFDCDNTTGVIPIVDFWLDRGGNLVESETAPTCRVQGRAWAWRRKERRRECSVKARRWNSYENQNTISLWTEPLAKATRRDGDAEVVSGSRGKDLVARRRATYRSQRRQSTRNISPSASVQNEIIGSFCSPRLPVVCSTL